MGQDLAGATGTLAQVGSYQRVAIPLASTHYQTEMSKPTKSLGYKLNFSSYLIYFLRSKKNPPSTDPPSQSHIRCLHTRMGQAPSGHSRSAAP